MSFLYYLIGHFLTFLAHYKLLILHNLFSNIWIAAETNTPLRKNDVYEICDIIVKSGRAYSRTHESLCPLMYSYYEVEYLGAAHGLCSILQVLLTVPGYMDSHPNEAKDIKNSIDFLLSEQDEEGNFPAAVDEIGYPSDLIHWCHGAGGMIFLMAKAYNDTYGIKRFSNDV